jgi:hypothetical protein
MDQMLRETLAVTMINVDQFAKALVIASETFVAQACVSQ